MLVFFKDMKSWFPGNIILLHQWFPNFLPYDLQNLATSTWDPSSFQVHVQVLYCHVHNNYSEAVFGNEINEFSGSLQQRSNNVYKENHTSKKRTEDIKYKIVQKIKV